MTTVIISLDIDYIIYTYVTTNYDIFTKITAQLNVPFDAIRFVNNEGEFDNIKEICNLETEHLNIVKKFYGKITYSITGIDIAASNGYINIFKFLSKDNYIDDKTIKQICISDQIEILKYVIENIAALKLYSLHKYITPQINSNARIISFLNDCIKISIKYNKDKFIEYLLMHGCTINSKQLISHITSTDYYDFKAIGNMSIHLSNNDLIDLLDTVVWKNYTSLLMQIIQINSKRIDNKLILELIDKHTSDSLKYLATLRN